MILHCDNCGRGLGDNLQDIRQIARVGIYDPPQIQLPDIVCFECIDRMKPPDNFSALIEPIKGREGKDI